MCYQHRTEQMIESVGPAAGMAAEAAVECCQQCEADTGAGLRVEMIYEDVLVGATRATREIFATLAELARNLKRTQLYRILTKTTQPTHAVSVIVVSFILVMLWPNLVAKDTVPAPGTTLDALPTKIRSSVLTQLAYLGSFATHFGAQIWMTFVSGLALYFSLPRHTFGLVQEVLFPKYFTLGTGLSIVSLVTFVKLQQNSHPELVHVSFAQWDRADLLQIVALALCALLELIVCLYLAPPMLRLMHEKHTFEMNADVGQEVGHFDGMENVQLLRSRHYQETHKKFRQIHMVTAIMNMGSLVCTVVHLHYLASRIEIH